MGAPRDGAGSDGYARESGAQIYLPTPLGRLRLMARAGRLVGVRFVSDTAPIEEETPPDPPAVLVETARQLRGYFAGMPPLWDGSEFPVGTPFQVEVWKELCHVPWGEAVTYGEVARRIGSPGGARAVGSACAANPLMLLIPCHRVVPAQGDAGGFAGGPERKRWLLAHERNRPTSGHAGREFVGGKAAFAWNSVNFTETAHALRFCGGRLWARRKKGDPLVRPRSGIVGEGDGKHNLRTITT